MKKNEIWICKYNDDLYVSNVKLGDKIKIAEISRDGIWCDLLKTDDDYGFQIDEKEFLNRFSLEIKKSVNIKSFNLNRLKLVANCLED